jgi:hypothetical protein
MLKDQHLKNGSTLVSIKNNFKYLMITISVETYIVLWCGETFENFIKKCVGHKVVEPVTFCNFSHAPPTSQT